MAKKLGLNLRELEILQKNLRVVEDYIKLRVIRTVGMIMVDLLAHALPRTPYDTGQLRASGTASVTTSFYQRFVVGKASSVFPHDIVEADLGRINSKTVKGMRRRSKIFGNVSFRRTNEEGKDIAVWAHEVLLPYVPRPKPVHLLGIPVATKPYTGPKYLEFAWNERVGEYTNLIKNIANPWDMETDIKGISRIRKRKYTKYTTDVVELVHRQLDAIGWNKITLSGQFIL